MAEESYFSGPNVTWFLVGIFAEVAFLGIGVTPAGMELGAKIAQGMGLIEAASSAAGVAEVVSSTGIDALSFG